MSPCHHPHLQVLIVTLETDSQGAGDSPPDNLFLNYLSRIHRDEDFQFILSGITRLLMNPLTQTYLPGSQKKAGTLLCVANEIVYTCFRFTFTRSS